MSAYSDLLLTHNPTVYLQLDEAAGPTASDTSGNGNNCNYTGGFTFQQTPLIQDSLFSVLSDGADSTYIGASPLTQNWLTNASTFTVIFWYRRPAGITFGKCFDLHVTNDDRIYIRIDDVGGVWTIRVIGFDGGSLYLADYYNRIAADTDYMLALTFNSGTLTLFINGVAQTPDSTSGTVPSTMPATDGEYRWCSGGGTDTGNEGLEGYFDHISLHTTALTPAEISALYDASAGPVSDSLPTQFTSQAGAWETAVLADSPQAWYRFDDADKDGPLKDYSGNASDGTYWNSAGITNTPGFTNDLNQGSIFEEALTECASGSFNFSTWTQGTLEAVVSANDIGAADAYVIGLWPTESELPGCFSIRFNQSDRKARAYVVAGTTRQVSTTNAIMGAVVHLAATYTASTGVLAFYVNGKLQGTDTVFNPPQNLTVTGYVGDFPTSPMRYLGGIRSTPGGFIPDGLSMDGTFDEAVFYNTPLSAARIQAHADAVAFTKTFDALPTRFETVASAVLPTEFSGFVTSEIAAIPTRFKVRAQSAAASLPTQLNSVTSGQFTGSVLSFTALVVLDGVDISAQLAGPISITHEEDASGIADFVIIPPAGPIDLNSYERKPVQISFVSLGIAIRRFTGVTASANYDPDSGLMTVDCTTDLQGQLEQMDRATINNLIGGLWSEWVFDDTADGWQYARDQLSTIQSEIHADVFGNLIVSPWKAKAVPDITLTDAERFSDSLTIERANLRDLLTKVRVNFDFRFTRLRHREIQVQFIDQRGFCDWANNNWLLAPKDMVRSAADGAQWTRLNEISYDDLPPTNPSICSPPRAWAGGAEAFCLGAQWQAGRRWAQTITEEFAIDVTSPDIAEAIGQQQINADYAVEATYDATDYEAQKDFTGPPADFVFSTKSNDWQKDADQNTADGRAAMEAAQTVAMEVARSEILGRARSNRVGVSNIYDPMMSLDWTVRINTPYCKATGKVALIEETINPVTGDLGMAIEIAVSRHGGTGLGAEDPLTPPPAPEQPQETNTGRIYTIGYHVGQEEFSPPDDPDWDGWITNVQSNGDSYFPTGESYDVRFVVAYPEVEVEARDELTADDITTYNIIVPEDELELSN